MYLWSYLINVVVVVVVIAQMNVSYIGAIFEKVRPVSLQISKSSLINGQTNKKK